MFTPAQQIPESVRRKAAAVHEAGHALVAVVLGRKVTGAVLWPPQGLSGETQFANEPDKLLDLKVEADRHIVEDAVVVLLAGKIAEAEHWKQLAQLYRPNVDSHWHDFLEIDRLLSGFSFNAQQKADYIAHCTRKAEHIILANESKAAIAEIAQKLWDTRSINRSELDEILARFGVIEI